LTVVIRKSLGFLYCVRKQKRS